MVQSYVYVFLLICIHVHIGIFGSVDCSPHMTILHVFTLTVSERNVISANLRALNVYMCLCV